MKSIITEMDKMQKIAGINKKEQSINQTPVEWLLYNLVYHNLVDSSPKSKFWELIDQAKQMEKKKS